jgi:hypothetical protein
MPIDMEFWDYFKDGVSRLSFLLESNYIIAVLSSLQSDVDVVTLRSVHEASQ